jgi:CBS-domain-containing membrane protein
MNVQPAMTRTAHAVKASDSAGATLRWMAHWELAHLPVVDANGKAVGILSLADHEGRFGGISRHLDDKTVENLMERPPTVSPRTRLMKALRVLRNARARALPVVDAQGRPLGLLESAAPVAADPPALTAIATHTA